MASKDKPTIVVGADSEGVVRRTFTLSAKPKKVTSVSVKANITENRSDGLRPVRGKLVNAAMEEAAKNINVPVMNVDGQAEYQKKRDEEIAARIELAGLLKQEKGLIKGDDEESVKARKERNIAIIKHVESLDIGEVYAELIEERFDKFRTDGVRAVVVEERRQTLTTKFLYALSNAEEILKATGRLDTMQEVEKFLTLETILAGKFEAAGLATIAQEMFSRYDEYKSNVLMAGKFSDDELKAFQMVEELELDVSKLVNFYNRPKFDTVDYDEDGNVVDNLEGLDKIEPLSQVEEGAMAKGQGSQVIVSMIGHAQRDVENEYRGTTDQPTEHMFGILPSRGATPTNIETEFGLQPMASLTDEEQRLFSYVDDSKIMDRMLDAESTDDILYSVLDTKRGASEDEYATAMAKLYVNDSVPDEERENVIGQIAKQIKAGLKSGFQDVQAHNKIEAELFQDSMKSYVTNGFGEIYKPSIQSYVEALPNITDIEGVNSNYLVTGLTRAGRNAEYYPGDVDLISSLIGTGKNSLRIEEGVRYEPEDAKALATKLAIYKLTGQAASAFYNIGGNSYERGMAGRGLQENFRNFGEDLDTDTLEGLEATIEKMLDDNTDRFQRDEIARFIDMSFVGYGQHADTRFALYNEGVYTDHITELGEQAENDKINNERDFFLAIGRLDSDQQDEFQDRFIELSAKVGVLEATNELIKEVEALVEEEEEEVELQGGTVLEEDAGGSEQVVGSKGTTYNNTPSDEFVGPPQPVDNSNLGEAVGVTRNAYEGASSPPVGREASTGVTFGGAPSSFRAATAQEYRDMPRAQKDAYIQDKFFFERPHLNRGPEAGTKEWEDARRWTLTSSTISPFIGKNSTGLNNAIKNRIDKIFRNEKVDNIHTQRGIRLEDPIADQWEKENEGLTAHKMPMMYNKNFPGATSLDRIVVDEDGNITGTNLEIKAPSGENKKYSSEGWNDPKYYDNQAQHQMASSGQNKTLLVQGMEGTGTKDRGQIKIHTSEINESKLWQNENRQALQAGQDSLDALAGKTPDQIAAMVSANQTAGSKTPYIFSEQHAEAERKRDQETMTGVSGGGSGKGGKGGGSASGVGGKEPKKKTTEVKMGAVFDAIADTVKAGINVAHTGTQNWVGNAIDMGQDPTVFGQNVLGGAMSGLTLGQSTNIQGQLLNMAGGMENGSFGAAKRLVVATRGALTFQEIQQYQNDPKALFQLMKSKLGGSKSDAAIAAMLVEGGIDPAAMRFIYEGVGKEPLGLANTANMVSLDNAAGYAAGGGGLGSIFDTAGEAGDAAKSIIGSIDNTIGVFAKDGYSNAVPGSNVPIQSKTFDERQAIWNSLGTKVKKEDGSYGIEYPKYSKGWYGKLPERAMGSVQDFVNSSLQDRVKEYSRIGNVMGSAFDDTGNKFAYSKPSSVPQSPSHFRDGYYSSVPMSGPLQHGMERLKENVIRILLDTTGVAVMSNIGGSEGSAKKEWGKHNDGTANRKQ